MLQSVGHYLSHDSKECSSGCMFMRWKDLMFHSNTSRKASLEVRLVKLPLYGKYSGN